MSAKASHSLKAILNQFSTKRVLVLGDLMLDHYIWGTVTRISPEAPVPVVSVSSETFLPGGAANVANNIHALGGEVSLCGVVGHDEAGGRLLNILRETLNDAAGVIMDEERPTTTKERVIAHHQQVVRFDREKRDELPKPVRQQLLSKIREEIGRIHCLVVSDYAKGVITPSLMKEVMAMVKPAGIPIVVDPKVGHFSYYRGATIVTPNHLEAARAAKIEIDDEETLREAGFALLEQLQGEAVLITRGEHGMDLFERNGKITHIPTVAKEVYDVTGAGDTVVSALALALAAGADFVSAAQVANFAAGIVVGMVGTSTVPREELAKAIDEA